MTTWPASGISRPAIIRSSVVLPQPDGPSSTMNSPSPISRDTSSVALDVPPGYVLTRSRRITSAMRPLPSSASSQRRSPHVHQVAAHHEDEQQRGQDQGE